MPLSKGTKKSSKRINWLFWGVFAFVGLSYAYYFLIYIQNNEQFLNQRSAHELQLFMQGIESRDQFFTTVAESNTKTNCEYLDRSFTTKFYCPSELALYDDSSQLGIDFDSLSHQFLYRYQTGSGDYLSDNNGITFYVSAFDFYDSLAREHSFFDRYLVLDDDETYYSNSFFQIDNPSEILDSLDKAGGYEVRTVDFSFKQKDYKTFATSFNLRGHNYSIIGFKDKSDWTALKREVDPMLSIGFLIGVILLIILIPHIKINNLSFSERLSHKDIFRVSSSLFLAVAFITITAYFILSFIQIKIKSHNQLSDNLDTVVKSLNSSVGSYDDLLNADTVRSLPGVNELFWATTSGLVQEIDVWQGKSDSSTIASATKEHTGNSLGHRDYIKRATENQSRDTNNIYLEFVKSITSSNTELVLSQRVPVGLREEKCDHINVVTSIPSALKKTASSNRFFYQIIDRSGAIYFDSRPVSGSGSLVDYTFEDESIKGFLDRGERKSKVMSVYFEDRKSYVTLEKLDFKQMNELILPVSDYYVCVFYDFEEANRFLAASSIVTFIANVALFVLLVIVGWVVRKAYHKKSSLAKKRFGFPWLLPSPTKDLEYLYLTIIFCILIVVQLSVLLLHEQTVFGEVLVFQVAMVLVSCLANYFVLTKDNILKDGRPNLQLIVVAVFTGIVMGSIFYLVEMNAVLTVLFYFSYLVALLALIVKVKMIHWLKRSVVFQSRRLSIYGFFISTWIMVAAFLPSINFSYTSGAYEKSISDWSKASEQRKEDISSDLIYSVLRVDVLADLGESDLVFDIDWVTERLQSDSTKTAEKSDIGKTGIAPLDLVDDDSEFEHSYGLAIVLMLLILPGMWYYIYIIRIRLFFHEYSYPKNTDKLSQEVSHLHAFLKKRNNCILLGLPYSGKSQIVELIKGKYEPSEVLEFDMMNDKSDGPSQTKAEDGEANGSEFRITGKPKLIIVKQLGHKIEDDEASRRKLELLTTIKQYRYSSKSEDKPVVLITSNVDLNYILNKYDQEIELRDDKRQLVLERDLWKSILYDFYVFTTALKEEPFKVENDENRIELFLKNELYHGRYLKGLYNQLFKEAIENNEQEEYSQNLKENLVLRIQEIATPYYMSIWKFCNKEDRLVLYDSAEDGYLNSSNRAVINRLLKSGLLVVGERGPRLMNESFGNFILSMANSDEALKLELEANRKGRWSSYRMITVLVILSLLLFLTLAEQHMVDKAIAILTAVIAIVPAIIGGARNFIFNRSPA